MKNKSGKIRALTIIFNLTIAIFAFAFFLGEIGVVEGGTYIPVNTGVTDGYDYYKSSDVANNILFRVPKQGGEVQMMYPGNTQWISGNTNSADFLNQVSTTSTAGGGAASGLPNAAGAGSLGLRGLGTASPTNIVAAQDLGGIEGWAGTVPKGTEFALNPNTGQYVGSINGDPVIISSKDYAANKNLFTSAPVSTTPTPNQAWLASKASLGGLGSAILGAIQWAAVAFLAGQMIGNMLGLTQDQTIALSAGMALGFGSYEFLASWRQTYTMWGGAFPIIFGIVAGVALTAVLWKEESQKLVTFECLPWEAPIGGKNCEKCNEEGIACSEYRCKALGQGCVFINKGTSNEMCAWQNSRDVNSPIMRAWTGALTKNHVYKPNNAVRPPDNGVKIINTQASDGCLKAFSPISFGISTDEPTQCNVDYVRTNNFSAMQYSMGSSTLFSYNHTQTLRLPSNSSVYLDTDSEEEPGLQINGEYNFYVRCKDVNGNENADLFVFNFCVESGPDASAPIIEETSIQNGASIQYKLNETPIDIFTNEPADCKWNKGFDSSYNEMTGTMTCSQHVYEMNNQMLYKCSTILNGLQDKVDNLFYFRCKDQPWLGDSADRNINSQGYEFVLKGSSNSLLITSLSPNGTIRGSGNSVPVELKLKTEYGSNNGDAYCSYSETGLESDYVLFKNTETNIHSQVLYLGSGTYTYYFQCVDLGGNAARDSVTFDVEIDIDAPEVLRAYNEAGKVKIVTSEDSTCSYSNDLNRECAFLIEDGINMPRANSTDHFAEWNPSLTYFIRCIDENGNEPDSGACSIIVKPLIN